MSATSIPPFDLDPEYTKLASTHVLGPNLEMFIYVNTPPSESSWTWVESFYDPPADEPSDSKLLVIPVHWHKYHDEIMTVLEGRMKFWIDGKEKLLRAGDEILIPRRTRHGFTTIRGVKSGLRERNVPVGTYKGEYATTAPPRER